MQANDFQTNTTRDTIAKVIADNDGASPHVIAALIQTALEPSPERSLPIIEAVADLYVAAFELMSDWAAPRDESQSIEQLSKAMRRCLDAGALVTRESIIRLFAEAQHSSGRRTQLVDDGRARANVSELITALRLDVGDTTCINGWTGKEIAAALETALPLRNRIEALKEDAALDIATFAVAAWWAGSTDAGTPSSFETAARRFLTADRHLGDGACVTAGDEEFSALSALLEDCATANDRHVLRRLLEQMRAIANGRTNRG